MDEGEGEAREVGSAPNAADDDIWPGVGHLHLLDRLLPDHRLVQHHVVQHRAERVLRVLAADGILDGLRDRHAQRAGRIGFLLAESPPGRGVHARARHALGTPRLHQRPAIRLLLVGHLHHVDLEVDVEERARHGQRRTPLARAGLGRDALDAFLLVVPGLGDGGVRLVAPRRVVALVLVEDTHVFRQVQRLLQPRRSVERGRAPELVDVPDRVRDLDVPLGRDFLLDDRHRE